MDYGRLKEDLKPLVANDSDLESLLLAMTTLLDQRGDHKTRKFLSDARHLVDMRMKEARRDRMAKEDRESLRRMEKQNENQM